MTNGDQEYDDEGGDGYNYDGGDYGSNYDDYGDNYNDYGSSNESTIPTIAHCSINTRKNASCSRYASLKCSENGKKFKKF